MCVCACMHTAEENNHQSVIMYKAPIIPGQPRNCKSFVAANHQLLRILTFTMSCTAIDEYLSTTRWKWLFANHWRICGRMSGRLLRPGTKKTSMDIPSVSSCSTKFSWTPDIIHIAWTIPRKKESTAKTNGGLLTQHPFSWNRQPAIFMSRSAMINHYQGRGVKLWPLKAWKWVQPPVDYLAVHGSLHVARRMARPALGMAYHTASPSEYLSGSRQAVRLRRWWLMVCCPSYTNVDINHHIAYGLYVLLIC